MNTLSGPRPAIVCMIALLALLASACAGPGYGYDEGVGIGAGYYEPYGYDYGGWGPGYAVGPYRGGHGPDRGGGGRPGHAYRSAPASRSAPSIPSGGRSGGGRR